MFRFALGLAKLRFQIESPFEAVIDDGARPFLVGPVEKPDISIRFRPVDSIAPPHDGVWVEEVCFCPGKAFFRNARSLPPYAMVEETADGLLCCYVREFERYVRASDSILNLIGVENLLLKHGGMLLHASFIRTRGRGILFSAPCGVGKSTQAALWQTHTGAEILNGDRAGIRSLNGVWTAFGMPFAGTSGIYRNESAPLAAIVALSQGSENILRPLRPTEAVGKLLPEISCRRWDSGFMEQLLNLLIGLAVQVPVYALECRPDEAAVRLLEEKLSKEGLL